MDDFKAFKTCLSVIVTGYLCFITSLNAQVYQLKLEALDQASDFLSNQIEYPEQIPDITQLLPTLEDCIEQLQQQGYYTASVDSIYTFDRTYVAKIHVGEQLEWLALDAGNVENSYLSRIGFRPQAYRKKPLRFEEVLRLQDRLLAELENNGYPFAQLRLDSIEIAGHRVRAQLQLNKGNFITVDSVILNGAKVISNTYLENYLDISAGSTYDKSKILRIKDRLKELPFLTESKDAQIDFYGDRAILNLYLKPKKASRFDFIIGVLPSTQTTGTTTNTSFVITGELKGELYNALGFGERIFAQIEQLRPATPRMDIQVNYPYILDLPFGVDASVDLYKQDSTFLTVAFDIGVQYLMSGGDYLKVFWENQSSALLSVNESRLLQERALPNTLDLSNSKFGVSYLRQKLDYRFNPSKGWQAFFKASLGRKTIQPNNRILDLSNEQFDFQSLYDSLNLQSFQYEIAANLATYLPLGSRATLKLSNQSSFIFSNQPIFQNEQFRLGGNRLLRGFDEQSIFASRYSLFTLEPRLLLSTNSYLYAFLDYAWLEDETNRAYRRDTPLGLGAGITLETAAGLFGMSLAIGNQRNQGLDFRSPKVHLGYVSLF
ncbi:MAG: BamA/TamA family outer membrane protein [Bacteroidota bacterium]